MFAGAGGSFIRRRNRLGRNRNPCYKESMRLPCLPVAVLISVTPQAASGTMHQQNQPTIETVCTIKNAAARESVPRPRLVSITAHPFYDRHSGYYLSDPGCTDRIDGTGAILIALPTGKRIADYPELSKVTDQSFLATNNGKRIHISCIGMVSYVKRQTRFELDGDCRVWASA